MYKSYQLKNYDNWLKTTAIASIYILDFIFIYFILKTVKKSLGKLAVSAKIIEILLENFYHSLLTMWSTSTSNFIKIRLDLVWFF